MMDIIIDVKTFHVSCSFKKKQRRKMEKKKKNENPPPSRILSNLNDQNGVDIFAASLSTAFQKRSIIWCVILFI